MITYQFTYDRIEDYDPEYSFWKRERIAADSYEEAKELFNNLFPGNKILSCDEVEYDEDRACWEYVPLHRLSEPY